MVADRCNAAQPRRNRIPGFHPTEKRSGRLLSRAGRKCECWATSSFARATSGQYSVAIVTRLRRSAGAIQSEPASRGTRTVRCVRCERDPRLRFGEERRRISCPTPSAECNCCPSRRRAPARRLRCPRWWAARTASRIYARGESRAEHARGGRVRTVERDSGHSWIDVRGRPAAALPPHLGTSRPARPGLRADGPGDPTSTSWLGCGPDGPSQARFPIRVGVPPCGVCASVQPSRGVVHDAEPSVVAEGHRRTGGAAAEGTPGLLPAFPSRHAGGEGKGGRSISWGFWSGYVDGWRDEW